MPAFDATLQVPTNWVAETPELSKKTNRSRGTAGPKRDRLIAAIAKDKRKSVSKLFIECKACLCATAAQEGTSKSME